MNKKLLYPRMTHALLLELDESGEIFITTAAAVIHRTAGPKKTDELVRCISQLISLGFVELEDEAILEDVEWENGNQFFPQLAAGLEPCTSVGYSPKWVRLSYD